ncbi:hypothetical protein PoB_000731800 [Plakobranchus ocellatus]|uniref:Uncharacterized protein n=1 Tax=Plakobranchus ocellatus TaxID=259542 RepID=A0AAV3YF93_9GAST|nr:hypothetical protein PoB_000731800 [Plakobranchus ocellatus]
MHLARNLEVKSFKRLQYKQQRLGMLKIGAVSGSCLKTVDVRDKLRKSYGMLSRSVFLFLFFMCKFWFPPVKGCHAFQMVFYFRSHHISVIQVLCKTAGLEVQKENPGLVKTNWAGRFVPKSIQNMYVIV